MPADLDFDAERRTLFGERISVALLAGALLFPLFTLVDRQLLPHHWRGALLLRLTASLICILGFAVNKTAAGRRWVFPAAMVNLAGLSVLKALVTPEVVTGDPSLAFAGHALLLVGSLGYLPLSPGQALLMGGTCLAGYVGPTLLVAPRLEAGSFTLQVAYLLAILTLLCLRSHLDHNLRRREFVLRRRLHLARRAACDQTRPPPEQGPDQTRPPPEQGPDQTEAP